MSTISMQLIFEHIVAHIMLYVLVSVQLPLFIDLFFFYYTSGVLHKPCGYGMGEGMSYVHITT